MSLIIIKVIIIILKVIIFAIFHVLYCLWILLGIIFIFNKHIYLLKSLESAKHFFFLKALLQNIFLLQFINLL